MKLLATLFPALLFLNPILAASPPTRRSTLLTRNNPNDPPPAITYDEDWAGAVLTGAGYRSVVGNITVPHVRLPAGGSSDVLHAVSAWVGIDGEFACPNAILQAGVDMYLNRSVPGYWAW